MTELNATLEELIADYEKLLKKPGSGGKKAGYENYLTVMRLFKDLNDPVERDEFVAIVARNTGISRASINSAIDFLLGYNAITKMEGDKLVKRIAQTV